MSDETKPAPRTPEVLPAGGGSPPPVSATERSEALLKTRLRQPNVSCRLDKDDLRSLCTRLQERAHAAADLEWAHVGDRFEEDREATEQELRQGFELRLTVEGPRGEELFGTISEVFDSPSFPSEVSLFRVNSSAPLRFLYNYWPRNAFEMVIDFRRPRVFDFTLIPSLETPNDSSFMTEGYEASWAHGLFHEISDFFVRHSSARWIHRHSIYDIFLWVAGYPLAFLICYRSSGLVEKAPSAFVRAALYLYLFLVTLFAFRVLFHYARWVFPAVEFKHKASRALLHRGILAALTLGLVGSLVYDLGKLLF